MASVGMKELANVVGLSRQRLWELAKKGKITKEPNGLWDAAKVQAALRSNLDTTQKSPARGEAPPKTVGIASAPRFRDEAPVKGTLAHAQLMHEQAKAARSALEAQRLEGKLVDRRMIEAQWVDVTTRLRNSVLGIPMRACNRLPAEWRRQLAAVLEDECRKTLHSLADEIRSSTRAA